MSAGLLWLALLHSVWIGAAVAAVVALAFQGRRLISPRSRHRMLLASLALVAAAPPALALTQHLVGRGQPARDSSIVEVAVLTASDPSGDRSPGALFIAPMRRGEAGRISSPLAGRLRGALDGAVVLVRAARPFALTVWGTVALGLAMVLVLGMRRVRRLCRDASPAPGEVQERARSLGLRLRLRASPAVRVHATLVEPCLCGVYRPVILLPARWLAEAPPESVEAVLAHELSHARRRDHLTNLAQRALEVLLFFHPGVHWLSRSLRHQAELCADALAVRLTGDPLALARALESVARFRSVPLAPGPVGPAFGGKGESLVPRIQELLGMTPRRYRPRFWPFAALPFAAAIALLADSVGHAQDASGLSRDSNPTPSRVTRADTPERPAVPARDIRTVPPSDRLMEYAVLRIDLEAQPWRKILEGRLTPLVPGSDDGGWILDAEGRMLLLNALVDDEKALLLHSPFGRLHEAGRMTFLFGTDGRSSAAFQRQKDVRDPSGVFDPEGIDRKTVQKFGLRKFDVWTDLSGTFSDRGTRLTFGVGALSAPADPVGVPAADRPLGHRAPPVPLFRGTCEVADGSSLLFRLGSHEHEVGGRRVTGDRLVLITPKRVVLDPEIPLEPTE